MVASDASRSFNIGKLGLLSNRELSEFNIRINIENEGNCVILSTQGPDLAGLDLVNRNFIID